MTNCRVCGNEYLAGSQYCDECGAGVSATNPGENVEHRRQGLSLKSTETPVFRSANLTSVGIPSHDKDAGNKMTSGEFGSDSNNRGVHGTLEIERGESGGKLFILIADESYIGRWDADNGVFPDVDLDAYDDEAKVSRRHARIIHSSGKYSIEDLGSTNGTYVNRGKRLIPGSAHVLNDGDEIIVGKIFLRFKITD